MVVPALERQERFRRAAGDDNVGTYGAVPAPPETEVSATQTAGPTTARPGGRRRRRRFNPYVVWPVVGLLLFGAGLLLVDQRVQRMTLAYELEAARRQLAALQENHVRLQAALAAATSLERTEAAARERLGMVDADRRTAVVVPPEGGRDPVVPPAPSAWAAVGDWLQRRLTKTAEAGERAAP